MIRFSRKIRIIRHIIYLFFFNKEVNYVLIGKSGKCSERGAKKENDSKGNSKWRQIVWDISSGATKMIFGEAVSASSGETRIWHGARILIIPEVGEGIAAVFTVQAYSHYPQLAY